MLGLWVVELGYWVVELGLCEVVKPKRSRWVRMVEPKKGGLL